jgi:tetratricopeptide (TPR) repeat protein
VELCPRCATHRYELGHFLRDIGRPDEAEVELRKAIEIDPELDLPHEALGAIDYFDTGRLDDALIHWRQAYALNQNNPWSISEMAKVYSDIGAREEALAFLARAQQLRPEGLSVWPLIVHQNLGNSQEATEYAQWWLDRDPQSRYIGAAVSWLNMIDIQEGRIEEALARTRRIWPEATTGVDVKVDGSNVGKVANYAALLETAGRREEAEVLYKRCLQFSYSTPLETAYSRAGKLVFRAGLLAALGRYDEALETLELAYTDYGLGPWNRYLYHDPSWGALLDREEFKQFRAKLDSDAARQLARLREMERNGEMPPAPGIEPWTFLAADESDPQPLKTRNLVP